MCSKRLKAALPLWLPFYEQEHGALAEPVRKKLLQISPATIDRLLKKVAGALSGQRPVRHSARTGCSSTRSRSAPTMGHRSARVSGGRHRRPLRQLHGGGLRLEHYFYGHFQPMDREPRHLEQRRHGVLRAGQRSGEGLPFDLLGFDVDNGSEFLTFHFWRYLLDRPGRCD